MPKEEACTGISAILKQGRTDRHGEDEPVCNRTTRNCIFTLDATRAVAQNPRNFSRRFPVRVNQGGRCGKDCALFELVRALSAARRTKGETVQYLPGWTVQCINPECAARGHWLRAGDSGGEFCSNCSSPLHNVPPPLAPRMRMRPRSLGSYRPSGRPSGRPR